MFKNLKFISMAVLFALLFQLNAFALSDDTSGKQPDGEAISKNEIPPELMSPTVQPPTPTAIKTATPSPVDDFGDTFSDAFSVESNHKINGNINYYGDVDVFSFIATSKSCYINTNRLFNKSITLYNKSHEFIEKNYAYDYSPSYYDSNLQRVISYDCSSIIYDNFTIGDTYYLKVGVETSTTQYSISLDPFTDNIGDTYSTAQIINANTLVNSEIDCLTAEFRDIDVFAFIPETSGTYSFDSSFPIRTLSRIGTLSSFIKLEKFDDNSKPIFLSPSLDESYRMNYDLIKGEKYYLTIQFNTRGAYHFTFNGPLSSSTPTILPTTLPTHTPPTLPPPTPRTGIKKGDVNDDGLINAVDFAYFRMYLLGNNARGGDSYVTFPYDINCDHRIDSIDFALLRKYLLGMIDSF